MKHAAKTTTHTDPTQTHITTAEAPSASKLRQNTPKTREDRDLSATAFSLWRERRQSHPADPGLPKVNQLMVAAADATTRKDAGKANALRQQAIDLLRESQAVAAPARAKKLAPVIPVETEPHVAEEVATPPYPASGTPDPLIPAVESPATPPEPATKQTTASETSPTNATGTADSLIPTWSDRIEKIDPGLLSDHPLWAEIAGPESPEREEELADDVRAGQLPPTLVMITGERCSSAPDTILTGHRYVHAVTATRGRVVLVVRRTDLDADMEELVLVKSALGSRHARQLTESQLAALEARLHRIYARPSGFRSDLETWVGSNAGSVAGRTVDLVASVTKEPRNAIANRKKVFGSPITHLVLRDAVDGGKVSLTAGAELIREFEAEPEVAGVLKKAMEEAWTDDAMSQNDVIQAARQSIEGLVREQLGKPRRFKPIRNSDEHKLMTIEQPGREEGDAVVLDCMFRSHKTRVTVIGRVIRIEDLGREASGKRQDSR